MRFGILIALLMAAVYLTSQPAPREQVGPLPGGGFLLNSGWRLTPAGRQIPLDTLPMASVLSADGRFLVVLNGGYLPPSLIVLRTDTMEEVGRTPVPDGWLGLVFSPDGSRLYVGGGSQASVFEFSFSDGTLKMTRQFAIVEERKRTHTDFIGDVTLSPDGRLIYAAALFHNAIYVINPQSGRVIERWSTAGRPYRIVFHPDGKSFFVTSWSDGVLVHHNAINGERLQTVRLGAHPTDIVWRPTAAEEAEDEELRPWAARLFIPAANTNTLYVVGVSPGKILQVTETVNLAMTPRQPLGMTPSAATLDPTGKRLYVVCSDVNALAVVDLSEARSAVLGFVPTGWYPTAARVLPDRRIVVLNGRGLRSYPNPRGPNPTRRVAPVHEGQSSVEYVGRIQKGSASVIDPFTEEDLERYSNMVLANSPYRDEVLDDAGVAPGSPIPTAPGGESPIQHVIYIVKENRTYDQVLGDLGKGNGDPSLTLFGEEITPNHHKLAREFVLFDNFYVSADVSADGHNWSAAAIANDYVQKMWPNSYGRRRRHYDYEGQERTALPPAGYLWSNALAAGLTVRNYGWWVTNGPVRPTGEIQVASVRDPALAKHTNWNYRGFDLEYPDVERAKVFLDDLREMEKTGKMPRLLCLRLGNDHTSGVAPGRVAPKSAVADNDYALGLIVEGISRSRFWAKSAIFVLEDDAQNGPDHVDSHRAPAFILSPYTRRGIIDSRMYNTTSMLRTMELILGLRPMTLFDAGARPMHAAFAQEPDLRPYTAEKPRVSLNERNPAEGTAAARLSAEFDYSEADRIDDDAMNVILWRALRGSEPPPPRRSFFAR